MKNTKVKRINEAIAIEVSQGNRQYMSRPTIFKDGRDKERSRSNRRSIERKINFSYA